MPMYEFYCEKCSYVTEENFKIDERPEQIQCLTCNEKAEYRISSGNYHRLNDPELRKKVLMERSAKHTEKELKHNYEKFGFKAFGGKKFTGVGKGKLGKKKQNK